MSYDWLMRPKTIAVPLQQDSDLSTELLGLIGQRDLPALVRKLTTCNRAEVTPHVLVTLLEEFSRDIPLRNDPILYTESEIEVPYYQAASRLDVTSPYYDYIYSIIPSLYTICKRFEIPNQQFQEYYIWLCYHMNDVNTLELLIYLYLHHPKYDSKVLGYVFSAFILNYEVEFAKTLLQNLVTLRRTMDVTLLETILVQMVKVDSLFENITIVYQEWIANNCSRLSPKALALILEQHYKHANSDELQKVHELIARYKISHHHLIRSINLQYMIIQREPYNFYKHISKQDIIQINEISNAITYREELVDFYYNFLRFFVKYSDMKMIQYVMMSLKEHHIVMQDRFYELISNYYLRNHKFLSLFKFLENTQDQLVFSPVYLKKLHDTFVHTYPYHAPQFNEQFCNWVQNNPSFSDNSKKTIIGSLKIIKSHSQLVPFTPENNLINSRKYDSHWSSIVWKEDKHGRFLKFNDQVQYRITKGFTDVLRKGVRPEVAVIKNTYKRSDWNNKLILVDLMKRVRLHDKHKIDLELIMLQARNDKEALAHCFSTVDQTTLTSNNRIIFARMLMNKNLFEEANVILEGINPEDLNDKGRMTLLNIELRNFCNYSNFSDMIRTIIQFPVDEIVLSPYIYNQCCYVEKMVTKKLQYMERKQQRYKELLENDSQHNDEAIEYMNNFARSRATIELTLRRLRGLIADINLRLEKDKQDLASTVDDLFKFLDKWTEGKS